ncbi:rab-like protein 3 isoform X2 [Heterodontus francisci]|uniref:rab-like protein 3 isoform X2 n=1 Tax=Heterodontus francisci TaxID=7792 RepID=UPI00355BCBFC
MASLERVKVLVLGDSGVGKSSLVHLLCHNQVLGNPSWTVGCSVDVRVHDYKEGTPAEKTYYIELWDVGGSVGNASSIKSTRAVFYNSVNGIILVHDCTNKKSSQNLYRWSLEALNKDSSPTGVIVTNGDYDREQFADNQIPLLVIGTKLDQIHETKRNEVLTRTAFLAEDFNAEEINLDCTNPRYLAAGSSNAVKLSRFFDKVIEKRYFSRDGNQVPITTWQGGRTAAGNMGRGLGIKDCGGPLPEVFSGPPHNDPNIRELIPGFADRKRFGAAGTLKILHCD